MKGYHRLILLTSKLPVFVQRIPYFFALKISQIYLGLSIPSIEHIWARHSYDCSYLVAGLSDLDLTIIYKEKPTCEEKEELINKILILKKMIPLLGEVNIFTSDLMKNLQKISNKYEIQRDQKTLHYYQIDLNSPHDRVQALVFLLKAVHANKKKLSSNTHLRINKWQHYLSLIAVKVHPITEKNVLNIIENQVNSILNDIGERNLSLHSFIKEEMNSHQTFVFCPSKWISDSFYQRNFDKIYQNEINQLTENEALILLYQFRWDIYGIASQIHGYRLKELNDMRNFINRIQFIGQKIGQVFLFSEYEELDNRIRFLNSYLLSYCSEDRKAL